MPRKDFQRDVARSCLPKAFPRLTDVREGTEDGQILFTYTAPSTSKAIEIQVLVPDTSEYPRNHQYIPFTATEGISEAIPSILDSAQPSFAGLSVEEFLVAISDCLDQATLGVESSWDPPSQDEDESESEVQSEDEMDWELDDGVNTPVQMGDNARTEDIRHDMRKAWGAGYRVSHLGQLNGTLILTVSYRISKLGLSQEAMQAWKVNPAEYLVLLIRYPQGFRSLAEILDRAGDGLVQMHLGVCEFYRPNSSSARNVFVSSDIPQLSRAGTDTSSENLPPLKPVFIGKTLYSLLNERFLHILKCRLAHGFPWTGAEMYIKDGQGRMMNCHDCVDQKYYERDKLDESSLEILSADHLMDAKSQSEMSFPLIAMQFTLRRFVRCTEFCLNCYCKIDAGFEALKPFVCSNELCLYQYMALGMGPSLEWEVTSQPYVVDLLISFAYSRATFRKLEDLPTGLQLMVPHPSSEIRKQNTHEADLSIAVNGDIRLRFKKTPNIKQGHWVVLCIQGTGNEVHACVKDDSKWPDIYLSDPVFRHPESKNQWELSRYTGSVEVTLYDTNFDLLNDQEKIDALVSLLDTLPEVAEMKTFIEGGKRGSPRPLKSWKERISRSALYVLQWIVGSNRSCIMYNDDPQHQVSGMEGYVQFRLAQGAPDKEQRFVASVTSEVARLKLKYPTLFAWHGSPLHNWHSILREGLHFKEVANGRSFGHGVYLSALFTTSSGYCRNANTSFGEWPNSLLKCALAISLNEVVNAPDEFQSRNPHYVVQHVDWIQPRYLFIKCRKEPLNVMPPKEETANFYTQDPSCGVQGPGGSPIKIPISALISHSGLSKQQDTRTKSRKSIRNGRGLLSRVSGRVAEWSCRQPDDDTESVASLLEDHEFLISDSEDLGGLQSPPAETDFRPGTLQASSLKLLGQPAYANHSATKILTQQLRAAIETQKQQPLHELGWYIDPNLANNLYQWIVELHSFDPDLQLARDLKSAGLTGIVLEIRFPPQFPLSPPFVRVIRPRFLRFAHGGGGHITAGGSLCMELLTNSGWSAVASIESVLLQVRMAISNTHPQPARMDPRNWQMDYTVGEAVSEYKRVCMAHGWSVPEDINELSWT